MELTKVGDVYTFNDTYLGYKVTCNMIFNENERRLISLCFEKDNKLEYLYISPQENYVAIHCDGDNYSDYIKYYASVVDEINEFTPEPKND